MGFKKLPAAAQDCAQRQHARVDSCCMQCTGVKVQAMYITPDGATQDEAVGILPDLKYPIGANQYTPATMLELAPPNYDAKVGLHTHT